MVSRSLNDCLNDKEKGTLAIAQKTRIPKWSIGDSNTCAKYSNPL